MVIGLSGAWWWQDHKSAAGRDLHHGRQSTAELNSGDNNSHIPLDNDSANSAPDAVANSAPVETSTAPAASTPAPAPVDNNAVVAPSADVDTAATPAPAA